MKKKISSLFAILFIVSMFSLHTEASSNPIKVFLDAKQLKFDVNPIVENGVTFVEFRGLFEALGLTKITYDPQEKIIVGSNSQTTIRLKINNYNVQVNEEWLWVNNPPKLVNGRTMIPLRFVSEATGAEVLWDANKRTINITSKATDKPTVPKIPEFPTTDNSNPKNSRTNPSKLGETHKVVRDFLGQSINFDITLVDLVSGNEAWQVVNNANMFNDEPKNDEEYILAKFKIKVISTSDNQPFLLRTTLFEVFNNKGTKYSNHNIVTGLNPSFRTDVYPNGVHEGWIAFTVKKDDNPVVVVNRGTKDEVWFDLRSSNNNNNTSYPINGMGRLYYEDGVVMYEGDLINGEPNGKGKSYYNNGILAHEGNYKNGEMDGYGQFYLSDGRQVYEGEFRLGEMHGYGKLYDFNGNILYEGEFIFGEFAD